MLMPFGVNLKKPVFMANKSGNTRDHGPTVNGYRGRNTGRPCIRIVRSPFRQELQIVRNSFKGRKPYLTGFRLS